jgi:hypothetical protein
MCIRGDLSFHLGCEFNPRLPSPLTYSSSRLLAICIPNTILSDFDDYAGMPGRSDIVLAGYNGFGVDGHWFFLTQVKVLPFPGQVEPLE